MLLGHATDLATRTARLTAMAMHDGLLTSLSPSLCLIPLPILPLLAAFLRQLGLVTRLPPAAEQLLAPFFSTPSRQQASKHSAISQQPQQTISEATITTVDNPALSLNLLFLPQASIKPLNQLQAPSIW